MSHHLLRICAVDRSSHSLCNDYQHLAQSHQKSLLSRATVVSSRLGRRRASSAPATPFQRRRRAYGSHSLQKIHLKHAEMASQQDIRRRASTADRALLAESVIAARATATTFASPPDLSRGAHQRNDESASQRHSRATSSTSRRNRLSLTLPVAIPSPDAARTTQSPVTAASLTGATGLPTPLDTPHGPAPPPSANDFIIAIAAQERRVFELKEELARAETELARLKKQWTAEEFYRKRSDSQRTDSSSYAPGIEDDALAATRRSIELDRRKLILQTQQSALAQSNRKVLNGSHTRTLSLLSPTKTNEGTTTSMHDVSSSRCEGAVSRSIEQRTDALTSPRVTKRSSWQPKPQSTSNIAGIPQIVEDFKFGFRAFVEDIRHITIGDEPITGQQRSAPTPNQRGSASHGSSKSQPTCASPCSRPARSKGDVPSADGSGTGAAPTAAAASAAPQRSKTPEPKPRGGKVKHFAWTPLGVDSIDDGDWSNWDSPVSTKSARWSGSTANSHGLDENQSVSEDGDESGIKGAKESAAGENLLLSPALDEVLPRGVGGRISPSSFQRTGSNIMDKWEKSLMAPESKASCA